MTTIINLKNFFKPKPQPLSYKHKHYLNTMDQKRLREILLYSEGDLIAQASMGWQNKKVLFCNDENHKYALKKVVQATPSYCLNLVTGDGDHPKTKADYATARGELDHLPIRKGFFDAYVVPLALMDDAIRVEKLIQKISTHMINGQKLYLSLRHPALDQILTNQNPGSNVVSDVSLSKVFEVLKRNYLFTEDLMEGHVDLSLKPYFRSDETDYYHEYKNTPLTVLFSTVKFQRKVPGSSS